MRNTLSQIFPNWQTKVLLFLYTGSGVWWVTIAARGIVNTTENYLFNLPLAVIPIVGGIFVLFQTETRKHYLRLSLIFLGIGLIFWGAGSLVYLYYNLVPEVTVPIWSIADIGYIFSQISLFIGVLCLARHYDLQQRIVQVFAKILFFVVPIGIVSVSFFVLILDVTKIDIPISPVFFNHLTSIPDFFIFSILLIILYSVIFHQSAVPKIPVAIFSIGYLVYYLADLNYTHTVSVGTFFVSNYTDFAFLTAVFLFAIAVNLFCSRAVFKH